MIAALTLLLGCELAGEALRRTAHLPIPGTVIGMLILTMILIARPPPATTAGDDPAPPSKLDRAADVLISNMGLLFVPAGVGVIAQMAVLKAEWLPIVAGLLGSTLLGLIVTGLVRHWTLPLPNAAEAEP